MTTQVGGRRPVAGRRGGFTLLVGALVLIGSFAMAFGSSGSAAAAGADLYVASGGVDNGSCTSAAMPCATVSYALTQAASGATIYVSGTIDDHVLINEQDITIAQDPGGSPAELDGQGTNTVVTIEGTSLVTLQGLTIADGEGAQGGGVFMDSSSGDAWIEDSVITDNTAMGPGGGIAIDDGFVNLTDSTVSDNTAVDGGGLAGSGSDGDFNIFDSTVSDNTATGSGPTSGQGGGLFTADGSGDVIFNSTVADNAAQGASGSGGGIFVDGVHDLIINSTISGNLASSGSAIADAGTVSLSADILATKNTVPAGGECSGTPVDGGYNVDDDGTCGLSAADHSVSHSVVIGEFLGTLQNNGGPTQTIALISGVGNPAQAVIPSTFPGLDGDSCSAPDQRGIRRGAPCDMGSFALTVGVAPEFTSGGSATFVAGSAGSFSIRATGTPPPVLTSTGKLPAGVTFGNGVISGTPQAGSVGTYPISITAANGIGPDAVQAFTLRVVAAAAPPSRGYWLVGADGGIFSFGSAQFHGSTGNLTLQRPVVGITPTSDRQGYWLVATDGGVFAFGDSGFYGSIPGLGLAPAGTPSPTPHLNAPIVGMVPSGSGHGYFMVGADGGVFAFGDAQYAGSCPGIGGCSGTAVAVMPDGTGRGYWLVTTTGNVYAFGDAPYLGAPGPQGSPVTSAVRSQDGNGYAMLFANGTVAAYGDFPSLGGPTSSVGGSNPATAIFTSDASGYWVASADGTVYPYGDAPFEGDMAGQHLNAPVIAATGS